MKNYELSKNEDPKVPVLEAGLEEKLLASRLVSEIRKGSGHLSITMTDLGMIELARAMQLAATEESLSTKQNNANNLFPDNNASLVSKKDAMIGFRVSHTTLWKWQRDGYLIPVKVGKKVYYRREDIMSLTRKEG